jgi:hypothetical protein
MGAITERSGSEDDFVRPQASYDMTEAEEEHHQPRIGSQHSAKRYASMGAMADSEIDIEAHNLTMDLSVTSTR